MKIEGVVISCYPLDVQLTRLCVASIRFWYPRIPIWLLKDRHYGDFNTREIERYWNVRVYPGRQENLGWGFGKLEVMTELPARRLLLIDSDIVFAGRVIDRLESFDEDLIVDQEDFDAAGVEEQFFALDRLRQLDPKFEFPGYGFNGGQIVATTGRITKQDFDGLLDWQTRTVMHPGGIQKGRPRLDQLHGSAQSAAGHTDHPPRAFHGLAGSSRPYGAHSSEGFHPRRPAPAVDSLGRAALGQDAGRNAPFGNPFAL